jgi:hypothetical protein
MKILIYPRRGVYVAKDRGEQYQMLRVLLNTLCVEELNAILQMSRRAKVVYHDEESVIEIEVPAGKANFKDDLSLNKLLNTIHDLDADYAWELAVVPQDHEVRKSTYNKSKNVLNPLMQIQPTIKVSL